MNKIKLFTFFVVSIFMCVGCFKHEHTYGEWVITTQGHYLPLICCDDEQPAVEEPHKDFNDDNYCDDCGYKMWDEHIFKWVSTVEGHYKTPLCGCCDYPDEVISHMDIDKDNMCDECKYSMIDINISWLYNETHHWYKYGDQEVVYKYDSHLDDNDDFICDVCDFFITTEETDALKTMWIYEDGTVLFDYAFTIGDTYRFTDRNIYVNQTLVFTLDDSCKHHYYEYYIDSIKVNEGRCWDFIETITVKKVLCEYNIEIHKYIPYNQFPVLHPFNCEIATLGTNAITPDDYSTHKFLGIYFDETFENEVTNLSDVLDLENKVLYVKWEEIPIEITLDLNSDVTDGIEAELDGEDKVIEKYWSEDITLPIPSITGFEFIGWYDGTKRITDNKGRMFWDIQLLGDVNLKAKWVRTQYYFNVKEILIDNVPTNILEIGKGINKSEHIIPENALVNNILSVTFIEDVIEDLNDEAMLSHDLHAYYFKPGHHFLFFTSVLNDVNSREHIINLDNATDGFNLYSYYETNEYVLEIYDDGKNIKNININYKTAFEKYILDEPLFEMSLEKEGCHFSGVYMVHGAYILDNKNKLLSDGLEQLELDANKNFIDCYVRYIEE